LGNKYFNRLRLLARAALAHRAMRGNQTGDSAGGFKRWPAASAVSNKSRDKLWTTRGSAVDGLWAGGA